MTIASEEKPFQFTLWHLAVATFFLCVILALIVQLREWGILASAVIAGCLATYSRWRWGFPTLGEIIVGLLIVGILFCLLLTTRRNLGGTPPRSTCSNNLKQLSLALQNYQDTYGSFPPAYVADDSGRPMHSWRVLLLPFLEQENLYKLYDFNEPWDGPNNRTLADQITRIYACPSDSKPGEVETSYLAIVGPATVWPGERSVKTAEIIDGKSNTILLVEVHNSGIHWMEPRDLHVTQMPLVVNAKRGQGISSLHPRGAQVAFVDGSVQFISDDLDPETLRALLTIAGGESVSPPY